MEKKDFWTID